VIFAVKCDEENIWHVTVANAGSEGTSSPFSRSDSVAETATNDVVDTISAQDQIGAGDSPVGRIRRACGFWTSPVCRRAYR